MHSRTWPHVALSTLSFFIAIESMAPAAEWRYYGGDEGGSRYSALDQINRSNVHDLKPAWVYKTGDISDGKGQWPTRTAFECTPIVVDGVMCLTTPFNRVVALNAASGEKLWEFDPKIDLSVRRNLFINRGAAYWTDGEDSRFIFGTLDGMLYSLDAKTGKPDPAFGVNGAVDLQAGMFPNRDTGPKPEIHAVSIRLTGYGVTSPPAIYKDTIITGSIVGDGQPQGASGDVRAWDVRTGELRWRFHTVPRPGEFGHETWEGDSWKHRSGVNAWAPMSVDSERGLVFLATGSPGYDYFGGDRGGDNLFGNCVIALNAETGERVWHFQTIHHDLWDWDLPAQPNLVTVRRGGRTVDAVAQVSKQGFLYLFDRESGRPLFKIEEREVSQRSVPGEIPSRTQPFPLQPPPFARQTLRAGELNRLTPELERQSEEIFSHIEIFRDGTTGPIYHLAGAEKSTLIFPGNNGGANWSGASFDPTEGLLYVNSSDLGLILTMKKQSENAELPWRFGPGPVRPPWFWTQERIPCQAPPWGHLTAIDLNSGEFRWRVPLGTVPQLAAMGITDTGSPNFGGSVVTAGGLVFIAASYDAKFRAFDKLSGEILWEHDLPQSGLATPMTYLAPNGKQYVAIAAGGGNKYDLNFGDELMVFALP